MTEDSPNQTTFGHDVFVSYASQDAAVANSIVESLEAHGLKCWIAPRDVKPGAQYADAIVRAINDARAIVLVMSQSAVASSHVGKEVERASSKRKPIVSFRIDAAPLNHALEYFLSESQWIDVPALGMKVALARLTESIATGSTSSPSTPDMVDPKRTARRAVAVAVTLIVVGAVLAGGWRSWTGNRHAPQLLAVSTISDKSIAVLPFTDMSEKKDQEYFADGMAEEIIDLLVKIPGLKVVGHTSSFQFKDPNADVRSLGNKLGAAYVLEGSVRKVGDRLRVTARLLGTRDGVDRWSNKYERPFGDVLKLQDELAAGVARAMEVTVGSDVLQSQTALNNADAYDLYLRGLHAVDRWNKEGFDSAASYFQQALDLDPSFEAASVELGWVLLWEVDFGFIPPAEGYERARRAVEMAIRLNPNSGSAHAQLAWIHMAYDWDWHAADADVKAALRLSNRDLRVRLAAGRLSEAEGHWDEAIQHLNVLLARDPLYAGPLNVLGGVYARAGKLNEAEAAERQALAISPTHASAPYNLAIILLARGNRDEVLGLMQRATSFNPLGLATAYFVLGRKAESDALLARYTYEHAGSAALRIGEAHALRGEIDEAFRWLDRAYEQKDQNLWLMKGYLGLKNLEPDPRYKAFLRKMNLPEG